MHTSIQAAHHARTLRIKKEVHITPLVSRPRPPSPVCRLSTRPTLFSSLPFARRPTSLTVFASSCGETEQEKISNISGVLIRPLRGGRISTLAAHERVYAFHLISFSGVGVCSVMESVISISSTRERARTNRRSGPVEFLVGSYCNSTSSIVQNHSVRVVEK